MDDKTKAEKILKEQIDSEFDIESFKKSVEDFFFGPGRIVQPIVIPAGEPEYLSDEDCEARFGSIDSKLHKGFLYQVKREHMTTVTGYGGVKQVIQGMRENGFCEYEIGFSIGVTMNEGLYMSTKFYPIHYAEFKQKPE